ncbi:hypothetical protein ABPG77_003105 [Micractinium sp. CCAP 211/92]
MGQGMSLEDDRFGEVCRQLRDASLRERQLHSEAAAEEAAGILPGYGSKQALYQAAMQHTRQLAAEFVAIGDRLVARNRGERLPKKPKPSPTWEEVLAGLTEAEPGTPAGSGSQVRAWRDSSIGKAAAPAGEVHLSEGSPLLPEGAGPSVPGLRRRPGHADELY